MMVILEWPKHVAAIYDSYIMVEHWEITFFYYAFSLSIHQLHTLNKVQYFANGDVRQVTWFQDSTA